MKASNLLFTLLVKFAFVLLSSVQSQKINFRNGTRDGNVNCIKGYKKQICNGTLNESSPIKLGFGVVHNQSTHVVRVHTKSPSATLEWPLFVIIRRQKEVISWELPINFLMDKAYNFLSDTNTSNYKTYDENSRTLCPLQNRPTASTKGLSKDTTKKVDIMLSTSSPNSISFELEIYLEEFSLTMREDTESLSKDVTISPTMPKFYKVNLDDDVDGVLLTVSSENDTCMTLSVQDAKCPVNDLNSNVKIAGSYQTVNHAGAMLLSREQFGGSMYVVMVAHPDESECRLNPYHIWEPKALYKNTRSIQNGNREKQITVTFSKPLSTEMMTQYIVYTLVVFIGFALVVMLAMVIQELYKTRFGKSKPNPSASLEEGGTNFRQRLPGENPTKSAGNEWLKYSRLYLKGLWIVALFYGIPVIQLVLTYERTTNESGNKDMCYYNFQCAYPFQISPTFRISDFNHLFSNIGYVIMGLLSLFCIRRHQTWTKSRLKKEAPPMDNETSNVTSSTEMTTSEVYEQYGLYYALGSAIILQGVMSACYHVCPNNVNFQFDTFFMFTISILVMVTTYNRIQPWQRVSVFTVYGALAAILLLSILGVYWDAEYYLNSDYNTVVFRICSFLLKMSVFIFLSYLCYTETKIKLNFFYLKEFLVAICKNIYQLFNLQYGQIKAFFMPDKPKRLAILVSWNIMNMMILAFTTSSYSSLPYLDGLLFMAVLNTFFFMGFYLMLKWKYKEDVFRTVCYVVLNLCAWIPAMWCFTQKRNNYESSPANSRNYNAPCEIAFYDTHDLWHFFGALGLFLSLMVLLTLDDDLLKRPPNFKKDFRVTKVGSRTRPITMAGQNNLN